MLSGLLGIGGGILQVPALNAWCGIPMRAAAALTAAVIGITALGSAPIYYARGRIVAPLAAAAVLGVLDRFARRHVDEPARAGQVAEAADGRRPRVVSAVYIYRSLSCMRRRDPDLELRLGWMSWRWSWRSASLLMTGMVLHLVSTGRALSIAQLQAGLVLLMLAPAVRC